MSLADQLFYAQRDLSTLETELEEHLNVLYNQRWDAYTFDRYDESLEVYGVQPLRPEDVEMARPLGFKKIWQHPGKSQCFVDEDGVRRCQCRPLVFWLADANTPRSRVTALPLGAGDRCPHCGDSLLVSVVCPACLGRGDELQGHGTQGDLVRRSCPTCGGPGRVLRCSAVYGR